MCLNSEPMKNLKLRKNANIWEKMVDPAGWLQRWQDNTFCHRWEMYPQSDELTDSASVELRTGNMIPGTFSVSYPIFLLSSLSFSFTFSVSGSGLCALFLITFTRLLPFFLQVNNSKSQKWRRWEQWHKEECSDKQPFWFSKFSLKWMRPG